jgi:hypothetical protein
MSEMQREKAQEYRIRAADCIGVAARMSDPEQKLILLLFAKAWLALAKFIETRNPAAADIWPLGNPPTIH